MQRNECTACLNGVKSIKQSERQLGSCCCWVFVCEHLGESLYLYVRARI
jgi:hypothetical protein